MVTQFLSNYEDSVHWMREQSKYTELVKFCYLDRDNLEAAKRFAVSEEFKEVRKLLQLTNRNSSAQVLDLGCGNGIASYAFASIGCQVTAVDPDTSDDVGLMAVDRLRNHLTDGSITTIQATAESLPFPDNTFNVIYERQALHHFSDLLKGLTECARVLKPDGLLLATREHVINNAQQLEQFLAGHILHQMHGGENAYPLKDYLAAFQQSGLRVSKCFAPFDTAINHFPTSNKQVKEWLFQVLQKKLGKAMASALVEVTPIETMYRHYLSYTCRFPGRLYSFLCSH